VATGAVPSDQLDPVSQAPEVRAVLFAFTMSELNRTNSISIKKTRLINYF
jgi:hypothetical protein